MSGDNNFDGDVGDDGGGSTGHGGCDVSDRAQDLTSDCLVHQSVNIKYYKTWNFEVWTSNNRENRILSDAFLLLRIYSRSLREAS